MFDGIKEIDSISIIAVSLIKDKAIEVSLDLISTILLDLLSRRLN